MGKFLRKRLISLLITLLLVSLVGFALTAYPPETLAFDKCHNEFGDNQNEQKCIDKLVAELGFDRPLFYFEIASLAEPDTLYKVYPFSLRKVLRRHALRSGNWEAVQQWHLSLSAARQALRTSEPNPAYQTLLGAIQTWESSLHAQDFEAYRLRVIELSHGPDIPNSLSSLMANTCEQGKVLLNTRQGWRTYVPRIIWHGTSCRYHQWISRMAKGDWGTTLNHLPVRSEIMRMVGNSAPVVCLGLLIAVVLGTWLGVASARRAGSAFDRISTAGVFALDAVPVFWAGILLLVLLANPKGLHIFPIGFDNIRTHPGENILRWVLPLVVYSYGGIAIVTRLIRLQVLEALNQDFVRTARAKGLSTQAVVWKHAFRQAWVTLATIVAGLIPALVGGSIIIEHLFTIHGIGEGLEKASANADTSFLLASLTLTAFLTAVGYLVADLLYVMVDPRIRLLPTRNEA